MVPLPSVFISHGSPMHALEAGAAGLAWAALGKRLGKPKAILVSSAHWETNLPMVTGADRPATIGPASHCANAIPFGNVWLMVRSIGAEADVVGALRLPM